MYNVSGSFFDSSRFNDKGTFHLNCDQAMNPYTWEPPINWTGLINGETVKFKQINASGFSKDDYDFSTIPNNFQHCISDIIQAIDEAMRTMD